jgi:hypothetical protein
MMLNGGDWLVLLWIPAKGGTGIVEKVRAGDILERTNEK